MRMDFARQPVVKFLRSLLVYTLVYVVLFLALGLGSIFIAVLLHGTSIVSVSIGPLFVLEATVRDGTSWSLRYGPGLFVLSLILGLVTWLLEEVVRWWRMRAGSDAG